MFYSFNTINRPTGKFLGKVECSISFTNELICVIWNNVIMSLSFLNKVFTVMTTWLEWAFRVFHPNYFMIKKYKSGSSTDIFGRIISRPLGQCSLVELSYGGNDNTRWLCNWHNCMFPKGYNSIYSHFYLALSFVRRGVIWISRVLGWVWG